MTKRQCGDCQLCCKLLAVPPLQKKAGETCRFQKFHKGCTVYNRPQMPPECSLWNCRWLADPAATADLSRPDRAHYVIDIMPDYVTAKPDDGEPQHIQVVQIWIDPKYPDAHRDPALRRWIYQRAEEGIATIVRYNAKKAMVIIAPPLDAGGEWHEITSGMTEQTHTFDEVVQALGGQAKVTITP